MQFQCWIGERIRHTELREARSNAAHNDVVLAVGPAQDIIQQSSLRCRC